MSAHAVLSALILLTHTISLETENGKESERGTGVEDLAKNKMENNGEKCEAKRENEMIEFRLCI